MKKYAICKQLAWPVVSPNSTEIKWVVGTGGVIDESDVTIGGVKAKL